MEDGVDRLEGIRELESEGVGAGLSNDVVWAKVFFWRAFLKDKWFGSVWL